LFRKIYFNDKPLFLTDKIYPEIEPFVHHDDAVLIDEYSTPAIHAILHEMEQPKVHAGIFLYQDVEQLYTALKKRFTLIIAAGGLVTNERGDLLFIFRKGKWDLPKGKSEGKESPEECAVRETEEETGLRQVTLDSFLTTTFHTYVENGKKILKETHWYRLQITGDQQPLPQTEEQITAVEWAVPTSLERYLSNTYPSILDVLQAAGY
jgi:8-oxo-dGTP pyrophosphatase MutT (NUDIX family)